jgi:glyoxylase-like metal-dependent hydrolase (beta-lactamase superfamily II)
MLPVNTRTRAARRRLIQAENRFTGASGWRTTTAAVAPADPRRQGRIPDGEACNAGPGLGHREAPEPARKPGTPESILHPGHTPGNVSIHLPAAGAIAVGDSFVGGHPLSRKTGPQMIHRIFHTDPAAALAATQRLDGIEASVGLPGHGPALRMPLAEALAALRS